MNPDYGHAPVCAAHVFATVTDLLAVQRVLSMLTGRNYALTRFEAEEAGAGRWRLRIDATVTSSEQVELLQARLHRVASVIAVDVRWAGSLGAAG